MIVVVNYGMGNLGAIVNMLHKIGVEAMLSSSVTDIERADKLILPGVGAFDSGVRNLNEMGLINILTMKAVEEKIPILGICLGMQLLTKRSGEGKLPGLGWLDAETVRFTFKNAQENLKTPHMGWNELFIRKPSYLFHDVHELPRFYFVHSYHVICHEAEDILTTTLYGYEFVSAVQRKNIMGVQFHPEKSHRFGLRLLKNFAGFSTNA
jgi:glutamine amidotransferase